MSMITAKKTNMEMTMKIEMHCLYHGHPFGGKTMQSIVKKFSQKEVSFKLHMKEIIRYNLMIIRHYLFSLPLCVKS